MLYLFAMSPQAILKSVGEDIRAARERRGFTQECLAHAVNVHRKTIAYIENGKRDFGVVKLAKICAILKTSPASILNRISKGQVRTTSK